MTKWSNIFQEMEVLPAESVKEHKNSGSDQFPSSILVINNTSLYWEYLKAMIITYLPGRFRSTSVSSAKGLLWDYSQMSARAPELEGLTVGGFTSGGLFQDGLIVWQVSAGSLQEASVLIFAGMFTCLIAFIAWQQSKNSKRPRRELSFLWPNLASRTPHLQYSTNHI